ncbi:hypothetical protein BBZ85_09105 [Neisseria gonorrhoeae]|nr:hypothetical protein BBZ85_09105 [Neisseria gonorrhoeae]
MTFGPGPKVHNSINMVLSFGKMCAVIDTEMAKFACIQYIIATITIRINNAVRLCCCSCSYACDKQFNEFILFIPA